MMEALEAFDRALVLWINGMHSPWADEFMWIVSGKITWIPLYVILLFLFARAYGWGKAAFFLIAVTVAVTLSDQISVHLFKNVFLRYRPSHHAELTHVLHFYPLSDTDFYKGGMYGFVSSHAANFMVVCLMSILALRTTYRWIAWPLTIIFLLVCYSRMYLGVHYASDLLVGALVGGLVAYFIHRFVVMKWIIPSRT
jgi:undecaprenyl-diphosphatase